MQSLYPDSVLMVAAIGLQNCPTPIWLSLYQGYMIYYIVQGKYVLLSFSMIIFVQIFNFYTIFFHTYTFNWSFWQNIYKKTFNQLITEKKKCPIVHLKIEKISGQLYWTHEKHGKNYFATAQKQQSIYSS